MAKLSIVIPTYNEERNVKPLYEEIKEVLTRVKTEYEIIFIDDGSSDKTFSELLKIHELDKNVKTIKFRANAGQTAALDAGFKSAEGDIIIAMDADLQNDPHDIPRLIKKLQESNLDCVSGWRFNRKDTFSKKIFSKFANILRKSLTKEKIHDSGCTLKAYRKECFEDLNLYGEMHRFIPALLMWKGFKVGELKVNHRSRKYGKTKYSMKRILKGFLDLIVVKFWMQYSTRPVHLFGGLGVITTFLGFIIGLYLMFIKFMQGASIGNRPLLLLSVLCFIIGIQFLLFGILADILIKDFYKDKRPYKIEKVLK